MISRSAAVSSGSNVVGDSIKFLIGGKRCMFIFLMATALDEDVSSKIKKLFFLQKWGQEHPQSEINLRH